MAERTAVPCTDCGELVKPAPTGPPPERCSKCKVEHARKRAREYRRSRPRARGQQQRACHRCGEPTTRRKWCSEGCRNKWRYDNDPLFRESVRVAARRAKQNARRLQRECDWCGKPSNGRFCSPQCIGRGTSKVRECALSLAECGECGRWRSRAAIPCACVAERRAEFEALMEDRMKARPCSECGVAFVPPARCAWFAKFCSPGCSSRYNRRTAPGKEARHKARVRRRAREKAAFVEDIDRMEIFARDGFKCQLCGKRLKMSAMGHDPAGGFEPLAPVLDHIVPLASGGTHERANVQAAHALCNSLKGDRIFDLSGDQLRLIA